MQHISTLLSLIIIFGFHSCKQEAKKEKSPAGIVAHYQTRDSANNITVRDTVIDAKKIGIVIIDMWNFHWCKTSAARVAAMAPRMNQSLQVARSLGIQVFFCPTDVANNYVGTPQRERAIAVEKLPLPASLNIECPHPGGGGCMCGADNCISNGGWNGMAEALELEEEDYVSSGPEELYSLCKQKGITELWYMGVHTNNCVLGKPEGMRNMMNYGFKCVLVRDLQDPETFYDPATGRTPDSNNALVVQHFEKYLAPSINIVELFQHNNLWKQEWIVDPVRITPWGKPERPHQFKDSIVVTLSAPLNEGADIRYTLDGSEPGVTSALYTKPFALRTTTTIRCKAFKNSKEVCTASTGQFVKLPAAPPLPDIKLTDLKLQPMYRNSRLPINNKSFQNTALTIHQQVFANGVATIAPSFLTYPLQPGYKRFVAQCGVDDFTGANDWGREVAKFPSVVFKIFIDGKLVSESPVMRNAHWAWSFDVEIPANSRTINLVATDAGDGNAYDYADWVNAGFITK